MISFPVQAVLFILLILFAYAKKVDSLRKIKLVFFATLTGLSLVGIYRLFSQYSIWKSSDLGQFLLSDYQFVFFTFIRILAPFLISVLVAFLFIWGLHWLNKRFKGNLFEREEPYLAATAIILIGYPALLFYFLVLGVVYLIWHVGSYIRLRKETRLPLYNLWIFVGLVTLILSKYWLIHTPIWLLLKI